MKTIMDYTKKEYLKAIPPFLLATIFVLVVSLTIHELGHYIAGEYYGLNPVIKYEIGLPTLISGYCSHAPAPDEFTGSVISYAGGYFTAFMLSIWLFVFRPRYEPLRSIILPFIIIVQLTYGTLEGYIGNPGLADIKPILYPLYGLAITSIIAYTIIKEKRRKSFKRNYEASKKPVWSNRIFTP